MTCLYLDQVTNYTGSVTVCLPWINIKTVKASGAKLGENVVHIVNVNMWRYPIDHFHLQFVRLS